MHVTEHERRPIQAAYEAAYAEERLRAELYAYHVEWRYSTGLYTSKTSPLAGSEQLLANHHLEKLRQRYLGRRREPFQPTHAFKRALVRHKIDHIYHN
jgi:hypothetical protein